MPSDRLGEQLFMDCAHVREGVAAEGYLLIEQDLSLGGALTTCRMCAACRRATVLQLQRAPVLAEPRNDTTDKRVR